MSAALRRATAATVAAMIALAHAPLGRSAYGRRVGGLRRMLVASTLAAAIALALPAGAGATTACEFSSGVLEVTMSANNDRADLVPAASTIFVADQNGLVTCSGGTPTLSNTDAIHIRNAPGLAGNLVRIFEVNRLAPGKTAESGDDEIETFVDLNNAESSRLEVRRGTTDGTMFFGTGGINPNASTGEVEPDADVIPTGVPLLRGVGSSGQDYIDAAGGRGTGDRGPPVPVELFGGADNDKLVGGPGNDLVVGEDGDDEVSGQQGNDVVDAGPGVNQRLFGLAGNDRLLPGSASDAANGGDGRDELNFENLTEGISFDLDGSSTAIEDVVGTSFNDVLRGDGGPNVLQGMDGNDVLEGRGGPDSLQGGLGGDSFQVRDGGPDTAGCGPDIDTVTADAPGIDTLTGCESVIFPPAPAPGGGGDATGGGGDATGGAGDATGGAGDATGGGGGASGGADLTPASLTAYRLSHSTFAAASSGPSVAAARVRRIGTSVRYTLSEPASVRFRVERAASGRRVGGTCRKPTSRSRQRRPCTRYLRLKDSFTHNGRLGPNSFKFTGRLRGRKLRPGRYRLAATATDAAGNRSKPKRVSFRIVRG